MEEKNGFVFYRSFYEAISKVSSKETKAEIFEAICELGLNDNVVELDDSIGQIIMDLIKPQLQANNKKYEDGKKGGRPPKKTTGYEEEKTTGFENKKTTGYSGKKPNENVNENNNENENENVNVNAEVFEKTKKQDPYINPIKTLFISEYEKTFNTRCYLSAQECLRLTELASEYPEIREIIPVAISKLKKISFNDISFKPKASWLLKSNNFERVMNGEFDTEDDNSWLDDWVKEGA